MKKVLAWCWLGALPFLLAVLLNEMHKAQLWNGMGVVTAVLSGIASWFVLLFVFDFVFGDTDEIVLTFISVFVGVACGSVVAQLSRADVIVMLGVWGVLLVIVLSFLALRTIMGP